MPLRVIEIVTPREDLKKVRESLEEHRSDEGYVFWASPLEEGEAVSFKLVLNVQKSESVMDKLEKLFSISDNYRIVVYPAEATLPRLPMPEDDAENNRAEDGGKDSKDNGSRNLISREELYSDVLDSSVLTKGYLYMTAFATVVAVIGMLQDNVAVIIGAMALAPLLGPNVGLSLAATLGDLKLARQSLKTLLAGIAIALALSAAAGPIVGLPESSSQFLSRTHVSYADVVLAVVSGAAAIISFTSVIPSSLVGVMVALALLPPLTVCGMLLGLGKLDMAAKAGLLFAGNVICLNLSGVATFLVQGIRPLSWWEAKRARKMTFLTALIWSLLLAALLFLIAYQRSLF